MKKVFSFILVVLMVIGIGVSILNFTANSLVADGDGNYTPWKEGTAQGSVADPNFKCEGKPKDCGTRHRKAK